MSKIYFDVDSLKQRVANGRPDLTDNELMELLQLRRNRISTWRARGGIPLNAAEDLAHLAGFHPCEIWTDYFEKVMRRESN